MITKLYNFFKENIKFFIILILIFLICTYELPYYIDAPGGLLNVEDRVYIEDSYEINGSLNLAYVTEMKATIPTLLISFFNDDWDVLKKEDVIANNETMEENEYRNRILLEESQNNAVIVGFNKANENIKINNRNIYVTYIAENANTDLKIGDQVIAINGTKVNNKNLLFSIVDSKTEKFIFTVLNNGKEYKRYAYKSIIDGKSMIGIVVSETKNILTDKKFEFMFKKSESGPSGGFMMALSIYDYLTEEDLTKGLKIVGTGTIEEDGTVGIIGGVEYKIKTAVKNNANIFFVPIDNYEEALKVKNEEELDIELVSVSNINDAINYLRNL